jgi:hypothetical protein
MPPCHGINDSLVAKRGAPSSKSIASMAFAIVTTCFPLPIWADTIASWDFNSYPPDFNPNTGTTAPAEGGGAAFVVGTTVTGGFRALGTSPDLSADNTNWRLGPFPAATTGNKSSGAQFNVDTSGHEGITIAWAQRNGDSSSRYWRVQSSTNGADFIDHTVVTNSQNVWRTFSASFEFLPGVNDNPRFAVRLVSEFQSTAINSGAAAYVGANPGTAYGSGGLLYLDTVVFAGTPINPFNTPPSIATTGAVESMATLWTIAEIGSEAAEFPAAS